MGPRQMEWVRAAGDRFDLPLRQQLVEAHRPIRFLACVLYRMVLGYRYRFTRIPVVVQLAEGCGHQERSALTSELVRSRCRHLRCHPLLNSVSAEATVSTLQKLAARPGIRKVWLDREVRAYLDVAAPTIRAPEVWSANVTGQGVTIAVIDTGVYPHEDLTVPENRVAAFVDLVQGRTKPYDDNGHGTHVAGIAAGNGHASGGRYRGVAPDARVAGVKVLDKGGSGRLSTVIEGVEWCVENRDRFGIRVLNLSLGAPATGPWREDPMALAVGAAWEAGLVVCCAAGNDGPEPGTIGTPGVHPSVITVGAADDHDTPDPADDSVAPFSSRGPTPDGDTRPDVVLPGARITSLVSPGSFLAKQQRPSGKYFALSGTSMATPAAAGLAALILQRHPNLTPDQVKRRLTAAARDLGEQPVAQGHGEVDGYEAVLGPEPARRQEAAAAGAATAAAGEGRGKRAAGRAAGKGRKR